jgi:FMN phosphatase YigB (HAD superfamily)
MPRTGSIELVCFDLGGVLVRIRTAWADLCEAAELEVRGSSGEAEADRLRGALSEAHMLGDLAVEEWIAAMGKALGGLYTAAELAALHAAVLVEEYPGVAALIDDLHRAGIATACLSNTNEAHWMALLHHDGVQALTGDARYPGVRRLGSHHASHLMRLTKPATAIYQAFEKTTGHRGSQILFFDDLPENVAAARAVGWRAERIDPAAPTDQQMRRHLAAHGVILPQAD